MAVRTRDELLSALKTRIGDDVSDEALTLIEDFTDTMNDYDSRAGEDWKTKYNELDTSWRQRYRDRFFSAPDNGTTTPENVVNDNARDLQDESEEKSFEELFEEKGVNNGY